MRLVRTAIADADIERTLGQTLDQFGIAQVQKYVSLIARALDMIAQDPLRTSSRDRSDLAPRLRSLHVSVASGRVRGASHVIFYLVPDRDGQAIHVIRLLHQSMEPAVRVAEGLNRLKP